MKHLFAASALGIGLVLAVLYIFGYSPALHLSSSPHIDPYRTYTALKNGVMRPQESATGVPTPSVIPNQKRMQPTTQIQNTQATSNGDDGEEWGVAKQIGEHTFTIKLGEDDTMGTPQEILESLNAYRQNHSRSHLTWDDSLAAYAQQRADYFAQTQSTDAHEGLNNYLDNEDGFVKLGFGHVGENSYYGGPLYAVHLIEWLFASSEGHDANQLDPSWSHVGIGVTSTSVNLVFGGNKL